MSSDYPFRVSIRDGRLALYFSQVWGYLPRAACDTLARRVSNVTDDYTGGSGVCEWWVKSGPFHIRLSPDLAGQGEEQARHVIGHELAHAYYGITGDHDTDEARADALATRWGFPAKELIVTHWKR